MSLPLIMHVNYCEQGQTLDEMCQKAVSWGYEGIEFRRKRSGVEETVAKYIDSVAAAAEKAGLKYVLFGAPGYNLMQPDADARQREIDEAIRFYQLAAKRVKLTVCNTMAGPLRNPDKSVPGNDYDQHGSAVATDEMWEWATAGFRQIGDAAQELGLRLAFESHMNYIHDTPAATLKLVKMIDHPAVGVNLDYGNAVYFKKPEAINKVIADLGDHLYYVHLKNSLGLPDGSRFPTGLADGVINHRQYLVELKTNGYTGPICVEAPRQGDREWFAQEDYAYLKALVQDLGL